MLQQRIFIAEDLYVNKWLSMNEKYGTLVQEHYVQNVS